VISDPAWSPLLSLQRATHATLRALTELLPELELSASEINVLANLHDSDGCTVGELAARAGSRSSTLTNVLDRLERRGMLRRVTRVGDRRAVQIDLTEDGRAAAAAIRHAIDDIEQAALGGLPAATIRGLRRGLQALAEASP
jgi:MarR family transcriptional regulator, organic hydroperoxide resistance regulator